MRARRDAPAIAFPRPVQLRSRLSTPPGAPRRAADDARGLILIAEDNEINQRVAFRMVEKLGYTPLIVPTGQDAVTTMKARDDVSLVLMDCQMPGMDGFEATRVIRAMNGHGARVPIVAMTAASLTSARQQCLESGMNDFLVKPVKLDDAARDDRTLGATLERADAELASRAGAQRRAAVQHFLDAADQRERRVGLLQHLDARLEHAVVDDRVGGVAGHVEHAHVRQQQRGSGSPARGRSSSA